ncbi:MULTISPECIES: energy-coupling factor transporter transmembrane protein EcfT [unclassified Methanoregula]|uniref:energy-coupling factor transporter transmembrane component T family protein n=1 Tax=unclassified Methanoregula TaxID=2649730 RepID=UPI0009D0317D|nr:MULTISPECIES: energy-coupling factor transporter transmembrane component T [unclassified Methanoregula]OPX65013.1 MAG: Energy-coupling factor transporter transmembrane protein EcfT [Methanoregula sp. PtaB.Bin085]OPY32383.1 MAG: Energy-coupling factor transporter transmembrane protein EcfT [Methanoregula sp. PtaU1.Bin006]
MAEILQYVHKDGFLHRLHPYTKIAFIIVVSIMCIIATDIGFLTFMVLAMLAFAAYGRLLTESLQQLKLILVMSLIFILITIITMPNGDTLGYLIPQGIPFAGGLIPVTDGGLLIGLVLTLRFMILIFAFQLFLISTQPRDLVHAMEKVGLPIDYILMFIIALRFIPTLQIEGQRIHEAQLARGFNPGSGFIGKIRSVAPIVVPLVSNALLRANVLGLTIDMRGYRIGRKTHIRERKFAGRDFVVMGILSVAGCGFIILLLAHLV